MKVRVTKVGKVYHDQETGIVFLGKEPIETKVTATVRKLLQEGLLKEVAEAPKVVKPKVTIPKD